MLDFPALASYFEIHTDETAGDLKYEKILKPERMPYLSSDKSGNPS